MAAERCTVDGTVNSLIFQNEDNGYTVLRLDTTDGEQITVVGCIPCAAPGEELIITGEWKHHPTRGMQIQADTVERYMPRSESGILSYLSSGAVKGVGPATAQLLVQRFGGETLDVLELEPERMTLLKGITARKAQEIAASFRAQAGMRRLMEFLAESGLSAALAVKLFKRFGDQASEAVRTNPYLLCDEFFGVSFAAADQIALSGGAEADSGARVEAAVLFTLRHNCGNGHVFLPRPKLTTATATMLNLSEECVERAVDALTEAGKLVEETVANVRACYLAGLYEDEVFVSRRILQMCEENADQGRNVEAILEEIQARQGIVYAPEQRQAVETAACSGVFVLTGGPGTGKTTCVRGIVALLERMGLRVALTAPTGRAAKRLGEACEREAQTIHRMLGMSYNEALDKVAFTKNEKDPLDADAVIVDETSMVDLSLMRALLAALRPMCRLILVGDADQLPSVGPGNVFSDLIRSRRLNVVELTEIFRQARQSAIVRNAHAINAGETPVLTPNQGDYFFLRRRAPEQVAQTIVELCKSRLPQKMGIDPGQIQVLSPTRKGAAGTAALNRVLQAVLNPAVSGKREKIYGDLLLRQGDRVMQIKNDYDIIWQKEDGAVGTGVFNGDVGTVTEIDPSGELVTVLFDDRIAAYTTEMLSELELAYAVTVHKAQGSEYKAVILAAAPCAPTLMVRNVLYTAITRARDLLILVGDDQAIVQMAATDRRSRRYSGLKVRLREGRRAK